MRVVASSDHQRSGDIAADALLVEETCGRGLSNEFSEGSGEFFGFVVELAPATCQARHRSQVAIGRVDETAVVQDQRNDLCDRERSELLAEIVVGGDDQRVELVGCAVTGLDSGMPGQAQCAHCFDVAVGGLRCDQIVTGQHCSGGRLGVD